MEDSRTYPLLTLAEMEEIEARHISLLLEELRLERCWPQNCPDDLRRRLEEVLSMRSHGPAEIWGVVRDWLVKSGRSHP